MHNFTFEQVCDGGQADMRMRPNIHPGAKGELGRAHLIEKMKGPTIRRCDEGSARVTEKFPRSRVRGTMIASIASQADASPAAGSFADCQLILLLLHARPNRHKFMHIQSTATLPEKAAN
jgi:hypothetical protein